MKLFSFSSPVPCDSKVISEEIQETKEYSYADEFGEIKRITGMQFLGSKWVNTRIILRE